MIRPAACTGHNMADASARNVFSFRRLTPETATPCEAAAALTYPFNPERNHGPD